MTTNLSDEVSAFEESVQQILDKIDIVDHSVSKRGTQVSKTLGQIRDKIKDIHARMDYNLVFDMIDILQKFFVFVSDMEADAIERDFAVVERYIADIDLASEKANVAMEEIKLDLKKYYQLPNEGISDTRKKMSIQVTELGREALAHEKSAVDYTELGKNLKYLLIGYVYIWIAKRHERKASEKLEERECWTIADECIADKFIPFMKSLDKMLTSLQREVFWTVEQLKKLHEVDKDVKMVDPTCWERSLVTLKTRAGKIEFQLSQAKFNLNETIQESVGATNS